MGSDPLDADELPYGTRAWRPAATGRAFAVHGARLAAFWQDDPATGIARKQILHGEEHFRIHHP